MEKKYKVLKRFGDYKRGDEFDPTADGYDGSDEDIALAVTDGFIKEIVEEGVDVGTSTVSVEPAASAGIAATSATVTFINGERTFSKAIHGEDFMDLAKEFAATNNGTIA